MPTELTGHPMDHGWQPHKPETWQYHFARLREPAEMWHYKWYSAANMEPQFDRMPQFDRIMCPAGQLVKLVMVSRFGDVGVTEDLTAENGYGARVMLADLYDFQEQHEEHECH